jgi:prepilin-type N-terminal cleavage/methylation domain-containing protein
VSGVLVTLKFLDIGTRMLTAGCTLVRNLPGLGQMEMQSEQTTLNGRSWRSRSAAGCASVQRSARCLPLRQRRGLNTGVSLIELLCVMVIITILASLLLPTVTRAYSRAKGFAEEWEAPEVAEMLRKESRGYCGAHPQYNFVSKSDFVDKCVLAPKCRDWVQAWRTEFVPFNYLDPTNMIVLSVHLGPKHRTLYAFSKEDLSVHPQR